MKMAIILGIYFWAAFWTGIYVSGDYSPEDGQVKPLVGPIIMGAMWPVMLPISILIKPTK